MDKITSTPIGGISAASLKISTGPKKGGEGGEGGAVTPPSPPLPPSSRDDDWPKSNAEFLAALFPSVPEGQRPVVCGIRGDPTNQKNWPAVDANDVKAVCLLTTNNYFNCSTFHPDPEDGLRAKKANHGQYCVLVLDDVGTKVSLESLPNLTPTYVVETSPGNFQYGYALTHPIDDDAIITALQKAVMAAGLCDPGAGGLARWARLPFGINGKTKYHDKDGRPFQTRLTHFANTSYTFDELYVGLGLQPVVAAQVGLRRPANEQAKPTVSRPALESISHEVFKPAAVEHPVVTKLKEKGWYKRPLGEGKHDITCPWVDEHTDGIDSGTAYFEPRAATPTGGLKCQHSHGSNLHVGKLLKVLDVDDQAARNKPEILYVQGALDQVVKASEYVLASTGTIYQADGVLVTLRHTSVDCRSEVANISGLTMGLTANCAFKTYNKREREWIPYDPPERVVRTLLGAPHYSFIPPLNGIARQPYYRPGDGTLVMASGYDVQSGVYGAFKSDQIKLGEPTREVALFALAQLRDLFSEFVFESPTDESAVLSAAFTAVARPYLPVAPAFLTIAPESGSGKSYLNSIIVQFAGGEPAKASFPLTADEATKSVLAHLMSSPACIEYDDMVCNFRPHAMLNRVLTSPIVTDRVLGVSKIAQVSTRTLFLGSGINVSPERDMNRRVISIRLASIPENRIGRTFKGKPFEYVRDNRMEMIGLVLTIIEAWKAAGRPTSGIKPVASYENEWSDHARYPLVWLDLPDPARSLFTQVEENIESETLIAFLKAWYREFGMSAVTVRRAVKKAMEDTDGALFEALEDIEVCDGRTVNRSRLGRYLARSAKSIVGGMRLLEAKADGRRGWRVEIVGKATPEMPPPSEGRSPRQW